MSIAPTTIANNVQLNALYNASDPLFQAQAQASFAFFLRYDLLNGANPTLLNNYAVFRYPSFLRFSAQFGSNSTTAANLAVKMVGSTGTTASATLSLVPGTVYHVAATWDSVAGQVFYLNGQVAGTAALAGTTQSGGAVGIHLFSLPGNSPCSLSDLAFWNGYALTAADVANLRDAVVTPATIGTPATVRFTFAGTVGATAAKGDPGLKNSIVGGITAADFTGSDAGWTAAYTPPLVWTPGAVVVGTVTTSGSLVRFTSSAVAGGAAAAITAVAADPTIKINGTSPGALIPLLTPPAAGPAALYRIPGGRILTPSDAVTYSAPIGAYTTPAGLTAAAIDAPATNCVGRSTFGADTGPKTFRPGMNFPWVINYYAPYCAFANLRYRISIISGTNGTIDDDGTITITSGTQLTCLFMDDPADTKVSPDQVLAAYPAGYFAVQFDDLDHVANPTTVTLVGGYQTAMIEDVTCQNPGDSGGVGKGGAFNYVPNGVLGQTALLRFTCPTGHGKIANLWISPPWDYTHQPGVPVSLDRSNPLRIDTKLLARFPNGLGSVRCIDSTNVGGGVGSSESEPEDASQVADILPSLSPKHPKSPGMTAIRPWDPTATPYAYNGTVGFGTAYQATLGAPITDTGTIDAAGRLTSTVTITDAATAPVIVGLTLTIDNEDLGVLAVSGTAVTVRRGSRSTTPATHSTGVGTLGSVMVHGRQAMTLATFGANVFTYEVVCSTAHGLRAGPIYYTTGPWPASLVDTNGHTFSTFLSNGNGQPTILVTGPTTFLIVQYNVGAPITTVAATTALDPTSTFLIIQAPNGGTYPIELIAALSNALGANAHVGHPIGANDDFVDAMARRVRDVMTPGRKVQIELGDEPWNTSGPWNIQNMQAKWHSAIYQLNYSLGWYVARAAQIKQRWVDRFNEGGRNRGGEIMLLLNQQFGGSSAMMTYAGNNGISVDTMAIAPYIDVTYTPVSLFFAAQRTCTDAELVDVMGHCTWYTTTLPGLMVQAGIVAGYNSTYGKSATLYGYEGGDQYLYAVPQQAYTVVGSVGAADTAITLASGLGSKILVGDYLLLYNTVDSNGAAVRKAADEWILVTAIAGDVLTVTRGLFGTTAAAHASTCHVRQNWTERTHDAHYHPNWAIFTNDFHQMLQTAGMVNLNHYAYTMPWASSWGVYTNAYQMPGKGDGTDGLADNRLALVTPGQAHTLPPTTVQDVVCVSTRGYGINQWMAQASSVVTPPTPSTKIILFRRG